MFAAGATLLGYFLNHVIAGTQFGGEEQEFLNSMMVFGTTDLFNLFSVPYINMSFFGEGMRAIFAWDFSFLQGNYMMIIFYIINIGMSFAFFTIVIGLVFQAFRL